LGNVLTIDRRLFFTLTNCLDLKTSKSFKIRSDFEDLNLLFIIVAGFLKVQAPNNPFFGLSRGGKSFGIA
jgi:hypothetical protein